MRFTSSEEYGLRCLLRLGREGLHGSLTIPEISRAEGISTPYVAKIMRVLRRSGYVGSARGKTGGYSLARPVDQVRIGELLALLGGRLFEPDFCEKHAGVESTCANSTDCAIRPVWQSVQMVIDNVLNNITLGDLLRNEQAVTSWVDRLVTLPSPGATSNAGSEAAFAPPKANLRYS
ncbi:MAG: RrF2 family transcriptional regulator [Terriglobia bacterium]